MILGFAILYEINIASLTILIRGVIGNIDPLFMVSSPVPVIKESDRLFSGNRREEPAYLGIAVLYITHELIISHGQSDHRSRRFRSLVSERDSL